MLTVKHEPATATLMMVPATHAENNSTQLDRMEKEVFSGSMYTGLTKRVSYWNVTPCSYSQEKHLYMPAGTIIVVTLAAQIKQFYILEAFFSLMASPCSQRGWLNWLLPLKVAKSPNHHESELLDTVVHRSIY